MTAFDDIQVVIPAGAGLALPVLAWLVLALVGHMKYPGWRRLGLLVPIFIAVTVALTWAQVPGRIGWMMSRGAMDHAAAACDQLDTGRSGVPYKSEKIGAYTFHHVERESDGACQFDLLKHYPWARSGFLYLPNGSRADGEYGHDYVHLGNSWYYYRL
ncbi:hypothetical protein AB0H20_09585 [Nocardia fluminea]|uniref:hypothetical protein n=1 Tax=Nocardia fluminea TaxID=134984 RepID=UPI0033E65E26